MSADQLDSFIETAKSLQIKGIFLKKNKITIFPSSFIHNFTGLTYKGNNPNQVLEPTVSVEMRIAPVNELAHPTEMLEVINQFVN